MVIAELEQLRRNRSEVRSQRIIARILSVSLKVESRLKAAPTENENSCMLLAARCLAGAISP